MDTLLHKLRRRFRADTHFGEVLRGSSWSFVWRLAGIVATYGFTWLVTRFAGGAAAWAYFALTHSALMVLGIFAKLGMDTGGMKLAAEHLAAGKPERLGRIFRDMLGILLPVNLVLSLALFLLAQPLAAHVFHKPVLEPLLRLAALALLPLTLYGVFSQWLRGFKSIHAFGFFRNVAQWALAGVLLLAGVILGRVGEGLAVWAFTGATVVAMLWSGAVVWVEWRRAGVRFAGVSGGGFSSRDNLKSLLALALPLMLAGSLFWVLQWFDTLVLGALATAKDVGIYNVALRLAQFTTAPIMVINSIIGPKFAELGLPGQERALVRVARQSSALIFWLTLPVLAVLVAFPGFFLGIFGEEFRGGAGVLLLIAAGQFVNACCGSVGTFLQMTGHHRAFQNILLIACAVDVVAALALIPVFGVLGAAAAHLLAEVCWNVVAALYIRRQFGAWVGVTGLTFRKFPTFGKLPDR